MKEQIISKVASVFVGLGVAWAVAKFVSPKAAGILGPAAGLLAHQKLDPLVARELRRAVG